MKNNVIKKSSVLILLCGALLLSCGCSAISASSEGEAALCINEVVTSNSFSLLDDTLGSPDWIELYNPTSAPISLKGYGLSDNLKDPHKWVFPDVTIPAGGYITVFAAKYEGSDELLCTGFGLSKSGETIYLTDKYYNVLHQLTIPELVSDISYARLSDGTFGYCSTPTPGAENGADIFVSAGDASASSAAPADALTISEVMPNNDSTLQSTEGNYYPWAELHNTSSAPVLLSDFYLSDSVAEPTRWRLPAVTIDAGEYAIVYFSGEDSSDMGEMHASFKLGSRDSALLLADGTGQVLSMVNWNTEIPSGVSVIASETYTVFPTPAEPNSDRVINSIELSQMNSADPVRINEVLKLNDYSLRDSYGDRSPWLELYNSSDAPISLLGCFLSDDVENPFKWAFPDVTIEGNSYLVVFLSGQESTETELHTSFSLARNENAVMFTDSSSMRFDLVEIDPNIGDNMSVGLGEDGLFHYYASPTPNAKNSTHAFDTVAETSVVNMKGVYISEVCAVTAAKSNTSDWIELHNASDSSINLEGWHLTDDPNDMTKFTFPSFKISSGGYETISASTSSTSGVSAPFNISATGETLILTDEDGNVKDVFTTGALAKGVTSGRSGSDPIRVFFAEPTKGEKNSSGTYSSFTAQPVFSDTALYHTDKFTVEITCPTPGANIYYTTDGSKPTTASTRYTGPISISSNTPLKAVAHSDGLLSSETASVTYLFEEPHTVPVVCLSTDSESFEQVYSVTDRWEKVEREGYFEYYETDGLLGTRFPCGLRVNGASTLTMRQKSLSIFLRGGYGQSTTTYPFFEDSDVTEYQSLCVRNSGQDYSKARLRDSYYMKAVKGLNLDHVETKVVVVYINAQYWGIYDLNENQNEDYLATHFGVDPDTVNIIRRNETPLAGDRTDFYRVRKFGLEEDTSIDSKYEQLCQWVDVDYFIDYLIAQSYFANGDMFNQKYWRTTDYTIKWRPIYYDLDLAFSASSPTRNILPNYFKPEGVPSKDGSITNMDIFVGLRKNASWCQQFGERYVYVMETHFTTDRLISILDEMEATLKPEMKRHIAKWNAPSSVSEWEKSVDALRECIKDRPQYALKYLKAEFGFTDSQIQQWQEKARASLTAAELPAVETP